ncbi:MAG TPA: recombinase RecT [Marinagarivorans sp.]|nr:recombinase RecT [Marinagarivorans sp.]HNG59961.1 recombinase RecT [Cellvibrionaceae bacterium]
MNNLTVSTDQSAVTTNSIIIQSEMFDRVMSLASLMASGSATIPKHLQKNQADCAAIIMQSMQWGMNPFAVAQKTHITQGGSLGYEAQLVNAVIMANGPLDEHPKYEFFGEWDRILGRVKEMQTEGKGKWYAKDWKPEDENGLGVICHYKIRGETGWRSYELLLKQCWPRFSTQWATDPQQQICYAAIKKVARRDFPGVILGVYTRDELEEAPGEIDITPPKQSEPQPEQPKELPFYPQEQFDKNLPLWQQLITTGKKTAKAVIDSIKSRAQLTEDQIATIETIESIEGQAEEVTDDNA